MTVTAGRPERSLGAVAPIASPQYGPAMNPLRGLASPAMSRGEPF